MVAIAMPAPSGTRQRAAAAELQAAARAAYRRSAQQGAPLTGAEIGRRFGRSARWGRDRIAEARSAAGSHDPVAETGTGGGHGDSHGSHRHPFEADGGNRSESRGHNGSQPAAAGQDSDVAPMWPANGNNGRSTASPGTRRFDTPIGQAGTKREGRPPAPTVLATPGPTAEVPAWVGWLAALSQLLVAVAAAVASVDHLAEVARLAGTTGWKVWLLPASVDGLATAAAVALYRAHRLRIPPGAVAWLALIGGVAVSVAGNIVAVHPELVSTDTLKIAVGAMPPLSLAIVLHLGLGQVGHNGRS